MRSTMLFLAATGLLVASTAQAQAPERVLLSRITTAHSSAGRFGSAEPARTYVAPILALNGERALLGRVDHRTMAPTRVTDVPVDGSRALLGKWPPAIAIVPGGKKVRS